MINSSTHKNHSFDDLFQKWNRKVYHYALKKTSSTYIAEETVQRTFIKLWKNCQFKDIPVAMEAQLFSITRTVLLDIVKEENRRAQYSINAPVTNLDKQTPYDIFQLKETNHNMMQLIEKMSPMRKRVFMLSRFEHLNYKEIAQQLSISNKTVENHINACLKILRKAFSYIKTIFIIF